MTGEELLASLNKAFGEKIQNKTEFRGETAFRTSRCERNFPSKDCRAKCPTSLLRKSRKWRAAHSSRGRARPLQKIASRARDRRSCNGGARLGRAHESEPRTERLPSIR